MHFVPVYLKIIQAFPSLNIHSFHISFFCCMNQPIVCIFAKKNDTSTESSGENPIEIFQILIEIYSFCSLFMNSQRNH